MSANPKFVAYVTPEAAIASCACGECFEIDCRGVRAAGPFESVQQAHAWAADNAPEGSGITVLPLERPWRAKKRT